MSRRLRILHTESSVGWGGQEIRILTEARGMLDRGHDVTLIAATDAQIIAAAARLAIPTVKLPIGSKRLGGLLALRRWLATHGHDYDVINTHSSTDSWLTAFACATLGAMPPLVRTRHVSTPVGRNIASRWLYRHTTRHVVTTGEAVRMQLHRDNGIPLEHMTSVRTGIDLERFAPQERGKLRHQLGLPDRPTIGIVATLRDWKGHDYLLDAFAALRARFPQWQLLIVGDGPRRAHLEAHIRDLDLGDAVHMAGNRDDVPNWLAAMDLFVLPSYGDEGVPQGIMQAMACAIPVISTPIGSIGEAVVDGTTGLLVTPRNARALIDAMARLMADDSLRQRFAEAGLAYARANFGIAEMLNKMERVFLAVRRERV